MYPFGNTLSTELVPNIAHLEEIAQTAAEAISQRYDTIYQYGNAMQTLYVTSGSSRDHMYGFFKTPLVFTYEMREGEESIFILPPEQIQPNSEEIFDSLIAIIKKSKELGYFQLKNWEVIGNVYVLIRKAIKFKITSDYQVYLDW